MDRGGVSRGRLTDRVCVSDDLVCVYGRVVVAVVVVEGRARIGINLVVLEESLLWYLVKRL